MRCKAKSSRTGKRCRRPAIKGGEVCPSHGGRAPQVQRAAALRELEARYTALRARGISVAEAFIEELERTAALVSLLESELATRLERGEITSEEALKLWDLFLAERRHLRGVVELGIRAGMEQKLANLVDRLSTYLEVGIRMLWHELGYGPDADRAVETAKRVFAELGAEEDALVGTMLSWWPTY